MNATRTDNQTMSAMLQQIAEQVTNIASHGDLFPHQLRSLRDRVADLLESVEAAEGYANHHNLSR